MADARYNALWVVQGFRGVGLDSGTWLGMMRGECVSRKGDLTPVYATLVFCLFF